MAEHDPAENAGPHQLHVGDRPEHGDRREAEGGRQQVMSKAARHADRREQQRVAQGERGAAERPRDEGAEADGPRYGGVEEQRDRGFRPRERPGQELVGRVAGDGHEKEGDPDGIETAARPHHQQHAGEADRAGDPAGGAGPFAEDGGRQQRDGDRRQEEDRRRLGDRHALEAEPHEQGGGDEAQRPQHHQPGAPGAQHLPAVAGIEHGGDHQHVDRIARRHDHRHLVARDQIFRRSVHAGKDEDGGGQQQYAPQRRVGRRTGTQDVTPLPAAPTAGPAAVGAACAPRRLHCLRYRFGFSCCSSETGDVTTMKTRSQRPLLLTEWTTPGGT